MDRGRPETSSESGRSTGARSSKQVTEARHAVVGGQELREDEAAADRAREDDAVVGGRARERRERGGRPGHLELRSLDERLGQARDGDRERERSALPVRGEQAEEEEKLLLDRDLVRLLVDEVDPLARAVEDDAEVGADCRDEALCMAERLADAVGRLGVLAAVGMRGDRLDAERAEHDREDDRGRRVRVVDDDPEPARFDPVDVERPQKVVRVGLRRARGRRDLCHLVMGGPAELLPLEVLLDLLEELGRRLDPRRLEELNLHDLGVGGARTHVHACAEALALQEVAVDRGGHDVEVGDLDARGCDPGDHGALQQPARRSAVAARHHPDAALQGRPERDPDPERRLRGEVDVHEARDRVAAEEPRGEPRLPDQVPVDERAGLDLLERVDADARHDDALLADRAAVARRRRPRADGRAA